MLISTMLAGAMFITGCSTAGNASDKLIVAMELAYPPFETKDDAGNPSGVSVDFAKAFGEYIGKEVEIVNTAWDGLIPSLKTGKADLIISSMTITDKRKEEVDFSILLLDEPTSALDPEYTTEVLNLINELKYEGMGFIIATHEMGFALHACEKVAFLCDGNILEYGDSNAVFSSPKTEELKKFLSKMLAWSV